MAKLIEEGLQEYDRHRQFAFLLKNPALAPTHWQSLKKQKPIKIKTSGKFFLLSSARREIHA